MVSLKILFGYCPKPAAPITDPKIAAPDVVAEVTGSNPIKGRMTSWLKGCGKNPDASKPAGKPMSKGEKAVLTTAILVGLLVLGTIAALLYAKFGHNTAMNGWMNNKFIPFFTDKVAPTFSKAVEWLKAGEIPHAVPIVLGATTLYAIAGIGAATIKRNKPIEPYQIEVTKASPFILTKQRDFTEIVENPQFVAVQQAALQERVSSSQRNFEPEVVDFEDHPLHVSSADEENPRPTLIKTTRNGLGGILDMAGKNVKTSLPSGLYSENV